MIFIIRIYVSQQIFPAGTPSSSGVSHALSQFLSVSYLCVSLLPSLCIYRSLIPSLQFFSLHIFSSSSSSKKRTVEVLQVTGYLPSQPGPGVLVSGTKMGTKKALAVVAP